MCLSRAGDTQAHGVSLTRRHSLPNPRGDVTSSPARGLGLAITGWVVTWRSQLRLRGAWPEHCPAMPRGHLSNGTDALVGELGGREGKG